MKRIGVLGGMGPRATAVFHSLLISICQHRYLAVEDTEFPEIIIRNVPLHNFTAEGITKDDSVIRELKTGILELFRDKVDFIAIDCNTVHFYLPTLRKISKIPIISIIDEVLDRAKKRNFTKLGLIGSQTTRDRHIYATASTKSNITIMNISSEEESEVSVIINLIMGGNETPRDIIYLKKLIDEFKKKGAHAVIIGCTELSIPLSNAKTDIPLLDSSAILAEATIQKSYGK